MSEEKIRPITPTMTPVDSDCEEEAPTEEKISPTTLRPFTFSSTSEPVCFDGDGLKKLFGIKSTAEAKNPSRLQSTGPGQLSKWDAMAGNTQSFIHQTSHQTTPRKKVLICHALLKDRSLTQPELALFSKLIEDCDVYLFEGFDQDLRKAQPLNHLNQLLDNREHIYPATESEVRTLLQSLSMSEKDWIIVDVAKYHEICRLPTTELDLTQIHLSTQEDFARVLASVDPLTITGIKLHSPGIQKFRPLKWALVHFPALHTLILSDVASPEFLQENLKTLELFSPRLNTLVFNTADTIKGLDISIPATSHLRTIRYLSPPGDPINIQIHSKLTDVLTFEIDNIRHRLTPQGNIKIQYSVAEKFQKRFISPMHNPRHLALNSDSFEQSQELIRSGYYKDILSLEINGHFMPEDLLNFAIYFPNLKSLDLTFKEERPFDADAFEVRPELFWVLPDLPYLESLSLNQFGRITLGEYPNLNYLSASPEGLIHNILTFQKPLPSLKIAKFWACTFISHISNLFHYFNKIEDLQLYFEDPVFQLNSEVPVNCFPLDTFVMGDSLKHMNLVGYIPMCKLKTGKNLRTLSVSANADDEDAASVIDIDVSASPKLSLKQDSPNLRNSGLVRISGTEHCPNYFSKPTLKKIKPSKKDPDIKQSDNKKRHPPVESKQSLNTEMDRGEDHGVSHFSLAQERTPMGSRIGETLILGVDKELSAYLTLGNGERVPIRDYHIQYFDHIIYDERIDRISFRTSAVSTPSLVPASKPKALSSMPTHIDVSHDKGRFKGNLTIGKFYPLPLTAPTDETSFQSYADLPPDVVLEIYQHPHTRKYFAHLKSAPGGQAQITLHYHFKPDPHYKSQQPFEARELPADEKLSPALLKKLEDALKDEPKLNFLWDDKLTKQEKFEKLREYCGKNQFDADTPLISKAPDATLEQLLAIIKEQRGACMARSQAFMVLAKYILRLDTWIINSETHGKCDIATKAGDIREIDLDGGGFLLIMGDRVPDKELLSALPKSVDITKLYEERIRQHLETRNVFTWDDKSSKPDLIRLPKGINAQEAFFQPKQLSEAFRTRYLNINNPADIKQYFEPYAERNGQRKKIDGPLKQILNEGGLLQINFSNFSHEERSDLQSLFEIPPKFRGKPIPAGNKLKVIGFISEDITCSPKFLSYFNVCELPTLPKQPVSAPPKKTLSVDLFAAADWYTQLMGNLLFGKDQLHVTVGALREAIRQKSSLIIHRPPEDPKFKYLLDQIRLEKRFYFNGEWVEVPEDFTIVLSQEALRKIRVLAEPTTTSRFVGEAERRTGVYTLVHDGLSTASTTKAAVEGVLCNNSVPEIKWAASNQSLPGEKIWLHLNNWYTLYEDLIYESDGSPRSVYGKLDQVAKSGKPTVFYVTETIPPLELERLALHIHTRYPDKAFTFQWAPGAGPHSTPAELKQLPAKNLIKHFLQNTPAEFQRDGKVESKVDKEAIAPYPPKQSYGGHTTLSPPYEDNRCSSKYYRTNDPGYIIAQLQRSAKTKISVIDLTPAMGSSELLVSVTQKETKEDDPKLRYNLKKHALFEALEKGETVILKGEVDPGLMQELLPLFGDQPFLRINGTQKPVTGRVIIIEPKTAKHPALALAHPIACDVIREDYEQALLPESKHIREEKNIVDKLLFFFEAAAYPHRGKTMPPNLGMSWERLVQMKKELQLAKDNKNPYRHKHNPLKSLMLNNYLKDDGTEYYQFLNVLCKFLFDTNPEHPIRLEKFQSLKKASINHPKDFTWRLLNTCNGITLREILEDIWPFKMKDKIQKTGGYYFDYWKKLSEQEWKTILDKLESKAAGLDISKPEAKPSLMSKTDKMAGRLKYLVEEDPNTNVIVIKGVPGVGKTHFLHLLEKNKEKYSCIKGLKNLKAWLEDETPGKIKLFLLDEINTEEPGMLAVLEGMQRDPPGIFWEDKWYPLGPDKKIVAAINFEYIEGRYFHDLLLKGKTECLELPDEVFLKQWLLTLCSDIEIHDDFAKDVLSVANFYKKQKPQEGYSLRDLQSLVQRYRILRLEAKAESPQQTLFSACQGEFALRITDPKKQQSFIKDAAQLFGFPTKTATDDKGIIVETQWFPAEMAPAHEAIRQALLIRDRVMEQKEAKSNDAQLAYKRGFLLQGAPSIGKLNLYENILKAKNIRYHVASTTDPNFRELAKAAFKDKAVLLLKDMHFLQSSDEKFLGDLLMGECEGVKATEPGFFVLGLKTLDKNISANSLSSALCNRMQVLTVAPYSNDSWQKLAKQELAIPGHAEPFVQALFHPSKPYPKPVNASTFFQCARDKSLHELSNVGSSIPSIKLGTTMGVVQ